MFISKVIIKLKTMIKPEYKIKKDDIIVISSFVWIILMCFMMVGYSLRDKEITELEITIGENHRNYTEVLNEKDSIIESKNKEIDSLTDYRNSKEYLEFLIYKKANLDNFKLNLSRVDYDILKLMVDQADENEIPYTVYFRLIDMESGFRFISNTESGAHGYMQLMPATFRMYYNRLGLEGGHTKENNIIIGSYMLREGYGKWRSRGMSKTSSWMYTLSEYNTGEGKMQIKNDDGKVVGFYLPGYTQKYVNFILKHFKPNVRNHK
jgi:soluble lytic murein transglycosylase-like protein